MMIVTVIRRSVEGYLWSIRFFSLHIFSCLGFCFRGNLDAFNCYIFTADVYTNLYFYKLKG